MDEKSPLRYLFFTDRYEAIVWICENQLSRRNLTDAQKTYLIGRQYEAQKMTVGNLRNEAMMGNSFVPKVGTKVEVPEHQPL